MNERIKELAKQSGAQGIVNRDFIDIKKFADLIIQECIECCNQVIAKANESRYREGVTEAGRVLSEGTKGGAINSKFLIMDRFGVE